VTALAYRHPCRLPAQAGYAKVAQTKVLIALSSSDDSHSAKLVFATLCRNVLGKGQSAPACPGACDKELDLPFAARRCAWVVAVTTEVGGRLASGRATVDGDERDAGGYGVLSISRAKMRSGVPKPSENRL
jgi:hypothetical protein